MIATAPWFGAKAALALSAGADEAYPPGVAETIGIAVDA